MKVEMVKGPEGCCLYFDDVRIVGPKPWGGGTLQKKWTMTKERAERLRALLDEFINAHAAKEDE